MEHIVVPIPVYSESEECDHPTPIKRKEHMGYNRQNECIDGCDDTDAPGMGGVPVYEYEVQHGETLEDLLSKHQIEVEVFFQYNRCRDIAIKKGVVVFIPKR